MDRFIKPNMEYWFTFTYPMVCTQIIDLFIPTSGPNVFTDEFYGIKGFGKHGFIPTQPVISQPLINEAKGGIREVQTVQKNWPRHAYLSPPVFA
jgi:hypothetical protein